MRLVFFSNTAVNLFNFRKNLIKNFINDNNEIILIFQKNQDNNEICKFFKNYGCKINEIYLNRHSFNPLREIITFIQIFLIYKKFKPNIAFHFTIKANIYGSINSYFNKVQAINNVTGLGYFFFSKGITKLILTILYKISVKYSSHTFFQNKNDVNYFLSNNLIKKKGYSIIPGSGIDLDFFKYSKYPKNKVIKLLFIGRLIKEKGINEFLKAAIELKKNKLNCEFYVLGNIDGNNKSNISLQFIQNLHKKNIINYLGEKKDIRSDIEKVDAVILPSYREGTSHSLLESCSIGRPIISTDIPGNEDILIENFNGFKCKSRDVSSLISAIHAFLNLSYEEKNILGLNARKLVEEKFNEKIVINKYNSIVKKICN